MPKSTIVQLDKPLYKVGILIMEIYKDIKGFEGMYQISNYGNARTVSRVIKRGNGTMFFKSKPLKLILNNCGYYYITPIKNNIKYTFRIHRLVCDAFLENELNKPFVNHINGIKTDNRVDNLEWCTSSENNKHAYDIGLKKQTNKSIGVRSSIIVVNLDNGIFYDSKKDAAKSTEMNYPNFFYNFKKGNLKNYIELK